jgi:hypothetical protein
MNRRSYHEQQAIRQQLEEAEAELDMLQKQIASFEAQVDSRLGGLLDQLSELNAETLLLDEKVRKIREKRLYGDDLMHYVDGAPKPAPAKNISDLPPMGLDDRSSIHQATNVKSAGVEFPDIKTLYRKLARRYHPDLARNDADRALSSQQMIEINQAYQAGDLTTLMNIAGIGIPYGVEVSQPAKKIRRTHTARLTEAEQVEQKIHDVRQEIARLSSLSIVRLSLDVKLKSHQGRDLLHEMAAELRFKVARKTAERDYLLSQVRASGEFDPEL